MSGPRPVLSIGEKAGVFLSVISTLAALSLSPITALFRGSGGASSYVRHLKFAVLREVTRRISYKAMLAVTPDLDEIYGKFTSSKGLSPHVITLDDGTRGYWLGDPAAEHVLFFCHGGGYALPANPAHLEALGDVLDRAKRNRKELSVLILRYDVSYYSPYPRQLQQATALLRYLLETLRRDPSTIIFAGDSAGGNLALALFSHILHPHPNVPSLSIVGKSFLGAALISPWVSFDTERSASMQINRGKDTLDIPTLKEWSRGFVGDAPKDYYQEPLNAPSSWWKSLPVNDLLITSGADEVLVDDISAITKKLQDIHPKVSYACIHDEPHDYILTGRIVGDSLLESQQIFESWVMELL